MVVPAEKVSWGAAQWSETCAAHLSEIFDQNEVELFRRNIERGEWMALAGRWKGSHSATAVLEVVHTGKGPVMHCKALVGPCGGRAFTSCTAYVTKLARLTGCISTRYVTKQPALKRMMERAGGQVSYLCELEVSQDG